MKREELVAFLGQYLRVTEFKDYAPNGLQIEGKQEIKKIVGGVSASLELINKAIAKKADAILVHHGFFWPSDRIEIVGVFAKKVKLLLTKNINLFAYHLPLDAHPIIGNNAGLLKIFNFQDVTLDQNPTNLIRLGKPRKSTNVYDLIDLIASKLQRKPLHIDCYINNVNLVAVCSGGAQNMLMEAKALGADMFITGEASEQNFHQAKEEQIHFIAAGHHATERLGVQNLGKLIQKKFDLDFEFIDIYNPI